MKISDMILKNTIRWIGIITLLVLVQTIAIKLSQTVLKEYSYWTLLFTGWLSCLIYQLLTKK